MKARTIKVGIPSGAVRMVLWEGTEDEEALPVLGLKGDRPYVKAYGVRYDLTEAEVKIARQFAGLAERR